MQTERRGKLLASTEVQLTFNSIETIPNLNASALFKVDSGKVF